MGEQYSRFKRDGQEAKPIPIRFNARQYEQLQEIKNITGESINLQVQNAVDEYLDRRFEEILRKAARR